MIVKLLPSNSKSFVPRIIAAVIATTAFVALPLAGQAPATTAAGGRGAAAPVAAAGTPAAPAASAVLAPPSRESWVSDRRTFAVGDIVTVLIDDYTITTAVKENSASDDRTRDLGLQASLPSASKNVGLDTKNGATQDVKGSSKRENRFQNEMSVRVVAVSANGLLQLKGTKSINVDKNPQDIQLTGWVRPQDVTAQNTIESARLADAQIGYASPGNLSTPKQSMVSKILGAFWP